MVSVAAGGQLDDDVPAIAPDGDTRTKLVDAAIQMFSACRYDGVSVREVERLARVNRGLVAYHFASKDGLWRAAVTALIDRFRDDLARYEDVMRDVSPPERVRVMLKAVVRFTARCPELFRLVVLHGNDFSERTEWLAREHLAPIFRGFQRAAGTEGGLPEDEVLQLFTFMGAAATVWAIPAVSHYVFDVDPLRTEFIERFADHVAGLGLFPLPSLTPAAGEPS